MSKLLKLKDWVTVKDAAKHLSISFGEDVSEVDVLRLGLDRRLTLSVNFVNTTKGCPGTVARYSQSELAAAIEAGHYPEDLDWYFFTPEMIKRAPNVSRMAKKEGMKMLLSLRLGEDRYLTLSDKVETLRGVWNLPMIGNEVADVEQMYQELTGGPTVTLGSFEGPLVESADGRMYRLLEDFEWTENQPGSKATLALLMRYCKEKSLSVAEEERLMSDFEDDRKTFLAQRKKTADINNYYPASGLPADAVIVVRTSALVRFMDDVSGRAEDKAVGAKERSSLLKMAIGMAIKGYAYDPAANRGEAVGEIQKDLAFLEIGLSNDTIRTYLREGAKLLPASKPLKP